MNQIVHLELEHWDSPAGDRERIENPSASALRDQLTRLDGNRIDSLSIEIGDVGVLTIGGGPDKFVVVSFPRDGSSSHVEADDPEVGSVELQIGGQTGVYPAAMALLADKAFGIASRFLSTGQYDQSLKWVRDCLPE